MQNRTAEHAVEGLEVGPLFYPDRDRLARERCVLGRIEIHLEQFFGRGGQHDGVRDDGAHGYRRPPPSYRRLSVEWFTNQ